MFLSMMPREFQSRSRRELLKGMAGGAFAAQAATTPASRPNILYLHSHDTGRYIQPYGHDVPAPNLQKLAGQGLLFRHAFDAAPTCSPSRASLLTGECPHNSGMLGLAHRGFRLNDYRRHILHTLRPQGYESALIGIQHIAQDPKVIGYDQIVPTRNAQAANVAPAAVRFLKQPPKQPFFLDVGFFETHREFHEPGPHEDARYAAPPVPIVDTPETRRDIAAFHASARVLDQGIGDVLDALESSGLAANTLVICTTDHGIAFPAMKCNLTVHGTGVFLILRGPGGFSGGRVSDAMVSQLDLFPTVCDLLGLEHPPWLQGRSLMPVVRGEVSQLHDEIFAEVNYHAAYEPKRAVRTLRWNYIRRYGDREYPVLPNCDDGLSKGIWVKNGWKSHIDPVEQLYDTLFDPNEVRNLAHDPACQAALHEMRGRLDAWMQRTDDPLLRGPVRPPSGAVVNDPDGLSPKEPTRPA
jgi:N-sulfoglucosamine sulfohydrolase